MIDDFNVLMPLLEQMTNEAMMPRHWKLIEALTSQSFDVEAHQFTLGTVLQPSLLNDKDKVEVSVSHNTHVTVLLPLYRC